MARKVKWALLINNFKSLIIPQRSVTVLKNAALPPQEMLGAG